MNVISANRKTYEGRRFVIQPDMVFHPSESLSLGRINAITGVRIIESVVPVRMGFSSSGNHEPAFGNITADFCGCRADPPGHLRRGGTAGQQGNCWEIG